jgi:hypothetical protein
MPSSSPKKEKKLNSKTESIIIIMVGKMYEWFRPATRASTKIRPAGCKLSLPEV